MRTSRTGTLVDSTTGCRRRCTRPWCARLGWPASSTAIGTPACLACLVPRCDACCVACSGRCWRCARAGWRPTSPSSPAPAGFPLNGGLLPACRSLVRVYGACTSDREHLCLIMVGAPTLPLPHCLPADGHSLFRLAKSSLWGCHVTSLQAADWGLGAPCLLLACAGVDGGRQRIPAHLRQEQAPDELPGDPAGGGEWGGGELRRPGGSGGGGQQLMVGGRGGWHQC